MDVIEDLAYPLPVRVISEMLGVPPEDHTTFRGWSHELARSLDPNPFPSTETIDRLKAALDAFDEYFRGLIAERRRSPRDDLVSSLIEAEEKGDRLSEAELLATLRLLLVAGHETTVNLIGNGTLALLRHPQQLQLLRDDPSLAASAVEEVLRYDPPVQLTGRIALEDIEIAGVTVQKGLGVVLLLGAANRDPDRFPDPERFDVTRNDDNHLAFGFGPHFCLGAPLARLEGQAALSTLVRRFQGLALQVEEPQYKENIVLRGLAALPVRFSPAT
jgi:cytochrome P450